jgi:ketosteroid isomerase-like protein
MNPSSLECSVRQEIIQANQKLLDAIMAGDWNTYQALCSKDLTCLEPEAPGQVVVGLDFHKFYFAPSPAGSAPGSASKRVQTTMAGTQVHLHGDTAVLAYVRLVQIAGPEGAFQTKSTAETRVWQKIDGKWVHIHFHRTPLGVA